VKLGEIVEFVKGKKPKQLFYKKPSEDFLEYVLLGDQKIYVKPKYSLVRVLPTDIIIVADGASSGKIFTGKNGILGSTFLRIRIRPEYEKEIDSRYLYFCLKYSENIFKSLLTGSAIPHVDQENLRIFEVLIPEDINEQKRIADILSAFDDKIELNNKIIKTLEEMAQEVFKEWFVRFRFPGWKKVKFVHSELGKIPEGWKATTLEEIMNLRREKFKSYDEWKNEKLLDLGRFPQKSLAINNYGKGEEIKTSAFKFYKGDILFGAVRPYFHKVVIAPFDGVTNQSVFVIFPKKQEFYSYLITILFSESTINYATNMASGTKMPVLKYEDLANMNIVLPDFKILSIFNETVDKFYKILIEKVEENQTLAELRDLLLPKLMSGEIRV
jgi:type I restriction enzyme S subunit